MSEGVPRGWQHRLVVAFGLVAISSVMTFGFGLLWEHDLRSPRVVLLGSGERLSVLVTAGNARVLLATGNDPSAFANALEQARHPTTRRLDVVLVVGSGRSLLAPASLVEDPHVRYRASVGQLVSSAESAALTKEGLPVFPSPRRIQLADGVSIVLESRARREPDGDPSEAAWQATVTRGTTTVSILSDGDAATLFRQPARVSALIVVGEKALAGWDVIPAPVLAVAGGDGSRTISGSDLRAYARERFDDPTWAIRLHPGEVSSFRFVDGGLELSSDAAQPLPVTTETEQSSMAPPRSKAPG